MRETLSHHGQRIAETPSSNNKSLIHEARILYSLLPSTQWIDIAAVALIFGLLINYVDLPSLFVWALFVISIISIRISISERYRSTTLNPDNIRTWFNLFLLGITLYGAMWSVTAILLVPSEIPVAAAFTAVVLCGLTAAGVAVSSVNLMAFTVYTVAAIWPYSFYLLASGQNPQTTIGILTFLFSIVIFVMGLRTNHFFTNMINLELKSDSLEKELQYEIRKRNLAENALLDNTLDEELADRIRQQSLALKEGTLRSSSNTPGSPPDLATSLELFNIKTRSQLENALELVKDLEEARLPENLKKQINIIDKILTNILVSVKKVANDEESSRQEILAIDYDDNDSVPINLRHTINYLVQAVPLVYKAKYITINRNIDSSIPRIIYGNKTALNKILSNLIINAIKYSDGGNVNITIEPASDIASNMELRFSITDTGVGMPAEVVDFLENDDSEDAGRYPGLAVVKHLIRKYGGKLHPKTTLGVGTEIEFHMPFRTREALTV